MRDATVAMARGSAARTTLDYIRAEHGDEALDLVLGELSPDERAAVVDAEPTVHIPYGRMVALWRAADRVLAAKVPDWAEQGGAYAIGQAGQQRYGGLLRKASPVEFVTGSVSLFRLYYSQGDMSAVEVEPGRAVLRLAGFDVVDALFCRRQVGGLLRATEIAGGKEVTVAHVRCALEGDAFCEWEVRWS